MFMSSLRSVYRKTRSLLRGSRLLNVCWGDMDLFWPSSSSNEQNTFSKERQISVQRSKPTDNHCISTNLPAVDKQTKPESRIWPKSYAVRSDSGVRACRPWLTEIAKNRSSSRGWSVTDVPKLMIWISMPFQTQEREPQSTGLRIVSR